MSEGQWALLLSGVAIVGQLADKFFRSEIRSDIADMRQALLDRIDQKYVDTDTFAAEMRRLDQRCEDRHGVRCVEARDVS